MSRTRELTYIAAITEALDFEMARDEEVVIFGEDVAGPFGGAFKVTKPLTDKYPPERIFNTPMCENAFISMGTGMSLMGMRPVIEMQFADFITSGFDSIVQFAATNHYRWGGAVPWVIRAPCDGGLGIGTFSQPEPGGLVHPLARPEGRGAGDPRRRQGAADRLRPRQQPGHLPGEQNPLPFGARRGARGRLRGADRGGADGPRRGGRVDHHLRGSGARGAAGCGATERGGHRGRYSRPPHTQAAGHRGLSSKRRARPAKY